MSSRWWALVCFNRIANSLLTISFVALLASIFLKYCKAALRSRLQQRVSPWWVQTSDGSYLFMIRSGRKPIEFEKAKAAIAVPSPDKLPSVIDTLITSVRNGELDEHLAHGSKSGIVKKRK